MVENNKVENNAVPPLCDTIINQIIDIQKSINAYILPQPSQRKVKEQQYKNNSCCGAASDAWVPSYPSLPIPINTFNKSKSNKTDLL